MNRKSSELLFMKLGDFFLLGVHLYFVFFQTNFCVSKMLIFKKYSNVAVKTQYPYHRRRRGKKSKKILIRKCPWIPEKNWELQLDRVPSPN